MNTILGLAADFWGSAPPTLRGLVILVLGLLGSWLLRKLVELLLSLLRFDRLADRVGLGEFLRKGGVAYRPARLVGAIAGWVGILATLLASSRALDIAFVNQFSDNLVAGLPGAIAALLVVIVGILLMSFLANVVETVARNAAWPAAHLAARGVWYVGTAVVLLIALDQLGLSRSILGWLLVVAFGAVALAFALAFGLGGQGLAREALEAALRGLRDRRVKDEVEDQPEE